MKLKPYPKYKDSGIQWIGEIPEEWKVEKINHIFLNRKEKNKQLKVDNILSVIKDVGVIRYEDKGNIGNKSSDNPANYKIVYPNDIVLNSMNFYIGSIGISKELGVTSSVYIVLTLNTLYENFTQYFYHIFKDSLFQKYAGRLGKGIMEIREAIKYEDLKDEPLPMPTLKDQAAIANFLDKKTAEIDALVEKDKRLIELLKEKRTALINHAVTKGLPVRASRTQTGLDPNVKLKDSGIEWVGKIPEGWEVSRLKNEVLIKYGFSLSESERIDGKFNVFGSNGIVGIHNKAKTEGKTIIIGRKGSHGKTNLSEKSCFPIDTTYFIDKSCTNFNLQYLFYLLTQLKLDETSRDSAVPGLSREVAYNKIIPYVSKTEQIQIAEYLDKATAKIDKTIKLIEKKIKLLQEFKKSLIHHVVTGKVDVRGVEA